MAEAAPNPPVLDPADPYARQAQTYPRLTPEQADRVAAYGALEVVEAGALLFQRGQRGADFFLVCEGAIEIFDTDLHGETIVVTVHGERQFSGEMDLFHDRLTLVSARASTRSRVVRIRRADFRRLISGEPDIGELIMRAFILRRVGFIRHNQVGGVLVGPGHAGDTQRLQTFMTRNGYPFRLLDTEQAPEATGFLDCYHLTGAELPVLVLPGGKLLRNPSNRELAEAVGLAEAGEGETVYDVAVVGAGPAGLAAAVYAASEGLSTVVLESTAPGGQAGTSSRIENYLGFPTGISGEALAGRAQAQAAKFGARLAIGRRVDALDCSASPFRLALQDGPLVRARSLVVATGARYRRLDLEDYSRFEGQGIHYAATAMEAQLCQGEEVAVVGGGNSAGQAAMFLSRAAGHVHIIIRKPDLAATMSDYLVRRIEASPRITIHPFSEVSRLEGDAFLRRVSWTDHRTGETQTRPIAHLFVMIGAEPNTDWLGDCLALDAKGFVLTGRDGGGQALSSPYATTRPGIYAVGDVRSGSVKRVASGVGEGSVVVQAIHRFLHPEVG